MSWCSGATIDSSKFGRALIVYEMLVEVATTVEQIVYSQGVDRRLRRIGAGRNDRWIEKHRLASQRIDDRELLGRLIELSRFEAHPRPVHTVRVRGRRHRAACCSTAARCRPAALPDRCRSGPRRIAYPRDGSARAAARRCHGSGQPPTPPVVRPRRRRCTTRRRTRRRSRHRRAPGRHVI